MSEQAKHTPGPWYVEGADAAVPICAETDGLLVAYVDYTTVRTNPKEYGSNASLIAAAPELLEALINTTQTLRLLLVPMDPADADARAEVRNEIKLAEAAIRKAEGDVRSDPRFFGSLRPSGTITAKKAKEL